MQIIADTASFTNKVVNGKGVQVIIFYAEWSGPCQMMAPVYKELAANYSGLAGFYTVDVEAAPALRASLGVIELPTIHFYKNGMVTDFVNGIISKNALIAKLENAVNQKH